MIRRRRLARAAARLARIGVGVTLLLAGCINLVGEPLPTIVLPEPGESTPVSIQLTLIFPTHTPTPTPTPWPDAASGAPLAANAITPQNVSQMVELRREFISTTPLLAAAFAPGDHRVATFGIDKMVRVIDADTLDVLRALPGHANHGFAVAWSPDGSRLVSAGRFAAIVWDMSGGRQISSTATNSRGDRAAWHPSGEYFAVVGHPSSQIDLIGADGVRLDTVKPGDFVLSAVAFSPNGSILAAADASTTIHLLSAESLETFQTLSTAGEGWDLEFSDDGSLLAVCEDGGRVEVWKVGAWTRAMSEEVDPQDCMDGAFSPTGLYVAATDSGVLSVWDPLTGEQLAAVQVGSLIWGVSVSTDGSLIALALDDGSLRIYGLP